jgi:hypothetical protein
MWRKSTELWRVQLLLLDGIGNARLEQAWMLDERQIGSKMNQDVQGWVHEQAITFLHGLLAIARSLSGICLTSSRAKDLSVLMWKSTRRTAGSVPGIEDSAGGWRSKLGKEAQIVDGDDGDCSLVDLAANMDKPGRAGNGFSSS